LKPFKNITYSSSKLQSQSLPEDNGEVKSTLLWDYLAPPSLPLVGSNLLEDYLH